MKHFLLTLLSLAATLSYSALSPILTPTVTTSMKLGQRLWPSRRPSVVGLVGGIASGKSTVSRVLAEGCSIAVIDADKLGHESYQPGTRCFSKLVNEFGKKIVAEDGTIDRRALGEVVFGEPANMARLQGIVWPEIRLLAQERINHLKQEGAESVVLEAAVLLEAGWDDMCDELWVVQVDPELARARLMKRNSLSKEQAEKRLASQPMTNEERATRATVMVSNDGTEEELADKVKQMWALRRDALLSRNRRRSLIRTGSAAAVVALIAATAAVVLGKGRGLR